MRTGLIVVGVIFLVLGAVLYFLPNPSAGAQTTTIGEDGADTRVTYATLSVSWAFVLSCVLIGAILLVLGLAIPAPRPIVREHVHAHEDHEEDYEGSDRVVETSERVTSGDGKNRKTVVREHREKHIHRKED